MAALTTGQQNDINKASPINNNYSVGSRLTNLSTIGTITPPSDTGTYTTDYETTTASATTLYIPARGMYYCSGTGYYTIQKPAEVGQELIILTRGTTNQHFRVASAGSGTTVCTICHGTYTTHVRIAGSSHGPGVLHMRALTTRFWIQMTGSGPTASGFWAYATSS